MVEKNIEMNIKNQENNYDILFPRTIPKQVDNLLNDDTKIYIGLQQGATPDDAFRSLYLLNILNDKCAFKLTVKTNSGQIIPNVRVESTSFIDSKGNPVSGPLLTNEKGEINTFFKSGNVTLSIKNYADLKDWSQQYQVQNGEQYEKEVQLETLTERTYSSSINFYFSQLVKKYDACLVAGGGGGGSGANTASDYGTGGAGGGGGNADNILQKEVSSSVYTLTIGKGGKGGYAVRGSDVANTGKEGNNGANGGTSKLINSETAINLVCEGGKGGEGGKYGERLGNVDSSAQGGIGNGNGGQGGMRSPADTYPTTAGTNATVYKFNDSELGLAGGGGGGGANDEQGGHDYDPPTDFDIKKGGAPYGGAGAAVPNPKTDKNVFRGYDGEKGKGPGGGGGAGGGYYSTKWGSGSGGAGADGILYLRMYT